MKRCPQCNSVFDDTLVYCTNDGTVLVAENFPLPSEASSFEDEEPTLVHHDPIKINVAPPAAPTEEFSYQPPPAAAAPIVVEKTRNTAKYLLFLMIGLLLGGGLVLATLLFARILFEEKRAEPAADANRSAQANASPNVREIPAETVPAANAKHQTATDADDDEFNGRVIALNAYVRSASSRDSAEVDVLPINDRLTISERANENSPWFYVTCEHGTSGWMHGNTIEYTR